jgi:hypothetical protein
MSATLAPGIAQVPEPAGLVSEAADLLAQFGYGPKFAAAQEHDRDLWGPAAVLLRTRRVALREVPSS